MSSTISTAAILAAKEMDDHAWHRIVDLYYPVVFAWVRRSGVSPADAADVCQEVFLSVMRSIGSFRRDHASHSFRAWLRLISRRRVADFFRAETQRQVFPVSTSRLVDIHADVPHQPETTCKATETQSASIDGRQPDYRLVEKVRCEFAANTWEAFWCTAVLSLSVDDTARALGMSRNAVYLARSRVRRRLREVMEESAR